MKVLRRNKELINVVLTSTFIAFGILLPYINFGNPQIGRMLLPMHIPILLCGFLCGPIYGLVAGLITPLLRSVLVGMPLMFPAAVTMSFELAAYGFFAGLLFLLFLNVLKGRNQIVILYLSLIVSLLLGRVVWAIAAAIFYPLAGNEFGLNVFIGSAFVNAWPGIILQLVLIPPLIFGLLRNPNIESHVLAK